MLLEFLFVGQLGTLTKSIFLVEIIIAAQPVVTSSHLIKEVVRLVGQL